MIGIHPHLLIRIETYLDRLSSYTALKENCYKILELMDGIGRATLLYFYCTLE